VSTKAYIAYSHIKLAIFDAAVISIMNNTHDKVYKERWYASTKKKLKGKTRYELMHKQCMIKIKFIMIMNRLDR
jgi:hypothetical protein